MMEIERPKIETASLSPDGRYGRFVAEPLERGFGITLGNSLRRVLLSSLPGVAVTSVKIDGVVHEFSTIEGVKEDVTEIVLNLKGIAAKLYTDGPKTVRVEAVGPCEVTADNIKQGDDIEILNPEWHIATLGEVPSSLWSSPSIRVAVMCLLSATSRPSSRRMISTLFPSIAFTPPCSR